MSLNDGPSSRDRTENPRLKSQDEINFPSDPSAADSPTKLLADLRATTLGKYRHGHATDKEPEETEEDSLPTRIKDALPEYLKEAKEVVNEEKGFSWKGTAKKIWGLWERFTNIVPSPWNTVMKWGLPATAVTTGIICYQAVAQLGVEFLKTVSNWALPLTTAALFVVPAVAAGKIWDTCEKVLKVEPSSPWLKHAIIKPIQAGLIVGGAIWAQTMDLTLMSYGAWAGAAVGIGYLASKIPQIPRKSIFAAAALVLALPWGHLATMRSYDVTVLSAGPDPEVAAWNVGTDLSVKDHWKGIFGLSEATPTGKSGMVLINRDVPLFVPPHRSANAFNADFSTLIGKKVRVTTIGGWLKLISPKIQPTIVKYEVLDSAGN